MENKIEKEKVNLPKLKKLNRGKALFLATELFKHDIRQAKTSVIFEMINSHYSTKQNNVVYEETTLVT